MALSLVATFNCVAIVPYVTIAVGSSLSGAMSPTWLLSRSIAHSNFSSTTSTSTSPLISTSTSVCFPPSIVPAPRQQHTDDTTEMPPNGQCTSSSPPCGLDNCIAVTSNPSVVAPTNTRRGRKGSGSTGSVFVRAARRAASLAASARLVRMVSARSLVNFEGEFEFELEFEWDDWGSRAPTHAATERGCRLGPHAPGDDPLVASTRASREGSIAAQPGMATAGGKSP
mmetsp:Transcript_11592/g.23368  ORF Transcript_11592/g.23368 Transcript_11592/m.23368 type:complete len:227 (+) Transcript_11592:1406-2086(+)